LSGSQFGFGRRRCGVRCGEPDVNGRFAAVAVADAAAAGLTQNDNNLVQHEATHQVQTGSLATECATAKGGSSCQTDAQVGRPNPQKHNYEHFFTVEIAE
jgi:hypothetical protein